MVRGGFQGRGRGRGRGHGATNGNHQGKRDIRQSDVVDDYDIGEINAHITERIRSSRPQQSDSGPRNNSNLDVKLKTDIRKYVHKQEAIIVNAEEGDWLKMPEVPTNDEIALHADEEIELIPNKIKGKWKTKERYLKAHYNLLREDAVSPLRDAVDSFRSDPDKMDDQHMSIYEKVFIDGFTFSQAGIATRIQFSTRRAQRKILWQGSKRLTPGSIVALTPAEDKFQTTCIVAVVAARPLDGVMQNPPEIDLFFLRAEDLELDPQKEWIMIESRTGYFEAYRHTLCALQKLSSESFPLSQHICTMDPDIQAPKYLQENPTRDLSTAARLDAKKGYSHVDIINDWPSSDESNLDSSQWECLNRILTKALAVIQGPPGTGKTYVSTVALELMNSHVKADDPPIIIAAQTNHALDQLLSHVARFQPNYIRLGGRSTNVEVKQRALYQIRKNERISLIPGSLLSRGTSNNARQSKNMRELLEPLHVNPTEPTPIGAFLKQGVISERQYASFEEGAARWITADGNTGDPLELWLGGALLRFTVDYDTNDFGLAEEDEDLEVEQLLEYEAEHGFSDEEDHEDIMHGTWCAVFDAFRVPEPSETELKEAAKLLDTADDLWSVPQKLRGPLYHLLMSRFKETLLEKFREQAEGYNKNLKDLRIGKWERDAVLLQRAKVIGLTTTGLSKYRALISSLKPKIILIEEAAEVLEAPVVVACMDSLEHLILVGDHEQLQGHCSVRDLEGEPYNLHVSLFERLVRNNMPFSTLLSQRRMHPEFRKLLQPIYPALKDHASVLVRPERNWGMGDVHSYFFDHSWHEDRDAQMSTFNDQEAQFIAGFFRWLILNGMPRDEITVLTFYNGQRKRILKKLRQYPEIKMGYNLVKTVDSYQGEENTLVILSLARHNYDHKIGFLENRNRVCVALSRAREGFYLFGSASTLNQNRVWMDVLRELGATGRIGHSFPVVCKSHGRRRLMQDPEDWKAAIGGCSQICDEELPCGHRCTLQCHPFAHDVVGCIALCERTLVCSHPCQQQCSQECSCDCEVYQNAWNDQNPGSLQEGPGYRREERNGGLISNAIEPGQFVEGKFLSGQNRLSVESYPYLPSQASKQPSNPSKNGASATIGPFPAQNTEMLYGDQWDSPSSSSQWVNSGLTAAEEDESRQGWQDYAAGGVRADDSRRDVQTTSGSPVAADRGHVTRSGRGKGKGRESRRAAGQGRFRHAEEYTPAAYQAGRENQHGHGKGGSGGSAFGNLIDL